MNNTETNKPITLCTVHGHWARREKAGFFDNDAGKKRKQQEKRESKYEMD